MTTTNRIKNARPDTMDFRDRMYEPTLVEVPTHIPLSRYRRARVPVLDQLNEGACTGFGLATVVHYLLRTRKTVPDRLAVSARMLYEMAKRHDEWKGEDYDGSSARGAMKGWFKHGVCSASLWPYRQSDGTAALTGERAMDGTKRPLGAYLRVNHKDLVAMHTAIAEVGILYATSGVHAGWEAVRRNGIIPFRDGNEGGHAFAIVAFDEEGFWIQNSWGRSWGNGGMGRIAYEDWLQNGMDVWVARLGVPLAAEKRAGGRAPRSAGLVRAAPVYAELRPHIVSIGNNGVLRDSGEYGTSEATVTEILTRDFPEITRGWARRRLLLYAHGGLVGEKAAIERIANYRPTFLRQQIYPLAFIWKTDFWTTLTNIIQDAARRRKPEGFLDAAKDFMLDRLDDMLEPLARGLGGRAQWSEMKENGLLAARTDAAGGQKGGSRLVAELVAGLLDQHSDMEVHVAGHSAGSIFMAGLVQALTSKGAIGSAPLKGETGLAKSVRTLTLWAPAITVDLFKAAYLPAIRAGSVGRTAIFNLTDRAEQDDHCAHIYHKSLLYLVSNAFEDRTRIPLARPDGQPILGMEKFFDRDAALRSEVGSGRIELVRAPNRDIQKPANHSAASHHGDFDDDEPTVLATIARILGRKKVDDTVQFTWSASSRRDSRKQLG